MENETDTNFGWWTDKPDRRLRQEGRVTHFTPLPEPRGGVWLKSLLIVSLITCLAWSLTLLASV
ncbi:conserved hypothetical protein [Burkholderiales bacterium 8X]|nr:conserved hypothetical protein [Burkholderiales bacterium 8X]